MTRLLNGLKYVLFVVQATWFIVTHLDLCKRLLRSINRGKRS